MSALEKIKTELKGLGYSPFYIDTPQGQAVAIDYCIPTGKYTGEKIYLGFSFQEEGYPEYPPHWIHISPCYEDQKGGSIQTYKHPNEKGVSIDWLALSRPPKDFWDDLPTKHMAHYLDMHVVRFCKDLK